MLTDEYFMQKALQQAKVAAQKGEVPIGAIITVQDTIIAKAHNQVEQLKDVTAHAEIIAITAAANHLGSKYLTQCTLYITLEPCLMCAGALAWSQIGRIVFAAFDSRKGSISHYQQQLPANQNILHPKTQITSGILQQEAEFLIKTFFQQKR